MAKKQKRLTSAQECGYETGRWLGRCPECGSWNTLQEEVRQPEAQAQEKKLKRAPGAGAEALRIDEIPDDAAQRRPCGIAELDRVLGGGVVDGSVVLVGGDPGVGKSTLLTQACAQHGACRRNGALRLRRGIGAQIKMRANRLGASGTGMYVLSENDMTTVERRMKRLPPA